jgi:hypothetical protein
MKHLKMSMYLLLTAAIFTSCEKETTPLSEEPAMNVQGPKSIVEIVKSGIDLETYFNSLPKPENTVARPAYSQILENPNLQFFFTPEDAPCDNLPTVDFENANYTYSGFPTPLDENSDNYGFSAGAILPGISFEIPGSPYPSNAFFVWTPSSDVLMSNSYEGDLVINFTAGNVTNVSMDVFNLNYVNMNISVYGASNVFLGSTWVNNGYYYNGVYFGVKSIAAITKIVISSDYFTGLEGVDNVSFGACNDYDGDGVLNENDAHPNSDLREYLNIGGSNTNIDNKMVKNGSTMMDQLNDLIAETNAQYNGENYDYLHKRFMTKLAQLTYNWRMARLITATQRSQISSIAWGTTIPYYNYET